MIFAVQEHNASHHHYDLRLSFEGVAKSWAIPKEPPTKKGIKRLAVQVEDHEIDYMSWEGTIPKGQYGAGTVKIWDKGSYETVEKDKDKWIFNLNGKELKGIYVLLRFKKAGDKNWLFFKK